MLLDWWAKPVLLQVECPWEIVCGGNTVAASTDFVEAENGEGEEVEEAIPNRDLRLKAFFEETNQNNAPKRIREVALSEAGDIQLLLTDHCKLVISIQNPSEDSWLLFRDGKSNIHVSKGRFWEIPWKGAP